MTGAGVAMGGKAPAGWYEALIGNKKVAKEVSRRVDAARKTNEDRAMENKLEAMKAKHKKG